MDAVAAARARALLLAHPFTAPLSALTVVDVAAQQVLRLEQGRLVFQAPCSTSTFGLGGEEGSYRTPLGWHRIHRRIGEGAPEGAVFRAREWTGEVWRGERSDEDLILTRVLTLKGLEPANALSLQRWIYLHGTNQEARLGEACSKGCVRLSNEAILELFDQVREGEPVLIASDALPGLGLGRLHFAGVAGSGMSALAQFCAGLGSPVSGSDRGFDGQQRAEKRALLTQEGLAIFPQDGSGVSGDCSAVVCSTAVEDTVPDVVAARRLGVPVLHRSELLAHLVVRRRTVAVSGTSGKSTTTAMIFELLRGAGRDPSVLTGGDLQLLQEEGRWGNARVGGSDLLVIEADESDGSLVCYAPAVGVVLNLQRDHKEPAEVMEMFRTFRSRCREAFVLGEAANLAELRPGGLVFGLGPEAALRAEDLRLEPHRSRFIVEGVPFELPLPGRHNVENALAALAACHALAVPLEDLAAPLARFKGVARRFEELGTLRGVTVVDDYAHNPAKVEAAIQTAQLRAGRVLAVFQPHGFGPLRFMRQELVETLQRTLRPQDRLWFLEVYYAGGTAARDIASADIVADLQARRVPAALAPDRPALARAIAGEAKEGDLVLVMGARDPSLPEVGQMVLSVLNRE